MNRYIFVLAAILSVTCAASLDWRVVGGSKAEDGQFPYQISIRTYGSHSCGGSIISDQWILTAAHCVAGYYPSDMTVVTGSNKLDQGGDTYKVARRIFHNEYNDFTIENDIGLLQIDGRIVFNAKVQPIPLETSEVGAGADVILSGWGTTSFMGETPNDLQFVPLKTITSEECNSRHENSGFGLSVSSSQLCTWTKIGEGACHGDSGGPLAHNGKVAGIVSWGYPCADGYPDVFTRVSSYIDWIKENTK